MSFRRAFFRLVMAALCALPPAMPMRAVATPARVSCDTLALQTPLVAWTAPLSKTARVAALAVRRRLDPLRATWTVLGTNIFVDRPGGGSLNIHIRTQDDSLFNMMVTEVSWVKEWLKGEDIPSVPNVIAVTLEVMYELLVQQRQQDYFDLTLEEGREMIRSAVVWSANLAGWSPQAVEYAILNFFSRPDKERVRLWGDLKRAFLRQTPRLMRDDLLKRLQVRELSVLVLSWPFVGAVASHWSRLYWRARRNTRVHLQRRLDRRQVAAVGRLLRKPQEPAAFREPPDRLRRSAGIFFGVASALFAGIVIVIHWGWLHSLSKMLAAATWIATASFMKLVEQFMHKERDLRFYDANKDRLSDWNLLHHSLDRRPWRPGNKVLIVPGLADIEQALAQFCSAVDRRDSALLSASIDYLREQIDARPHRGNPAWDVLPFPIREKFIAWMQEDPRAIHWRDWVGLWAAFYGFSNPGSQEEAMFRRAV